MSYLMLMFQMLSQNMVLEPSMQDVIPHAELRYLFIFLHKNGCWGANPQSHHNDYQNFSLYIHFSEQRH